MYLANLHKLTKSPAHGVETIGSVRQLARYISHSTANQRTTDNGEGLIKGYRSGVHGAPAFSQSETGLDGLRDELFGSKDGIPEVETTGEERGHCSRQHATGAVEIRCFHARRGQLLHCRPIKEDVHGIAFEMATFHVNTAGAHPVKSPGSFFHGLHIGDLDSGHYGGFGKIRCNHERQREQSALERLFPGM